jgi:hypothetical protein
LVDANLHHASCQFQGQNLPPLFQRKDPSSLFQEVKSNVTGTGFVGVVSYWTVTEVLAATRNRPISGVSDVSGSTNGIKPTVLPWVTHREKKKKKKKIRNRLVESHFITGMVMEQRVEDGVCNKSRWLV